MVRRSKRRIMLSDIKRDAINVVSRTRAARRIEHAQQAQLICASILDAVNLSFRQINARTGGYRRVCVSGPHAAAASQNKKHFFVVVKMIGRAAGGNRADELRDLRAADCFIDQHAIPAIGGSLCFLIDEANSGSSIY